jgi:hypothetical protein
MRAVLGTIEAPFLGENGDPNLPPQRIRIDAKFRGVIGSLVTPGAQKGEYANRHHA